MGVAVARSEVYLITLDDPSFSTRMEKAYQLHLLTDFKPEVSIEAKDITEVIDGGREFLAAVSRYISERSEGVSKVVDDDACVARD